MKRLCTTLFPYILALMVVTLLLSTASVEAKASAAHSSSTTGCSGWKKVPSPSIDGSLYGVAAASANDAWAVGYNGLNNGFPRYTLTERWNGTMWSVVKSPSPGTQYNWLLAVAAASANDIWAVGYADGKTLTEHWNGTGWSVVSSPNPGSYSSWLLGAAVFSANDVWAVGYYSNDGTTSKTLIEHWNGTRWSVIPSPNGGGYNNFLQGVTAISATDVWTVGSYEVYNGSYFLYETLTEHWNGSMWSIVPSANRPNNWNYLYAVASVAGTKQVWTVGYSGDGGHLFLTERWNGNKWSLFPIHTRGTSFENVFNGVASAGGPNKIFAVGFNLNLQHSYIKAPLIEQWDGSRWRVSYNSGQGDLTAVAAVPGSSHLWAVGTEILSYC